MAITKVSQLARLSNPALITALTGRSYNTFGQFLGSNDIVEISYKKNVNTTGSTEYYSVGASISDIRFDLVGKYSPGAVTSTDNSIIQPILTYDSRYANRYNAGDLLFYPKDDGLKLIKKLNTGTGAPSSDTIAPYGLYNTSGYSWQYAALPWDSWMLPLFATIRTVGKIANGYWQEVLPYNLFSARTFEAAYNELSREFDEVINNGAKTKLSFNKSTINKTPSNDIEYTNLNNINSDISMSAVYSTTYDRYILRLNVNGKTIGQIESALKNVGEICKPNNSTGITMPFFAFTVGAIEDSDSTVNVNYISVPYYTLSNNEPNRHTYCCLGNSVSADTSSYNISPVWAYDMIKNKETKLESTTLNINRPAYETSASHTTINIKNPTYPLLLKDGKLTLSYGDNGLKVDNNKLVLNIGSGLKFDNNKLIFDTNALNPLNSKVNTVSSNVNAVSSNVNAVSSTVNKVSTNVNAVSSTVNKVSTNVNAVSSKVNTVSSNVNAVSTNVNALSANVNALSANVNTISNKVNTVSANVNALSALITSLNKTLQKSVFGS